MRPFSIATIKEASARFGLLRWGLSDEGERLFEFVNADFSFQFSFLLVVWVHTRF